ncbi:hypothetical protein JHK87_045617 [Glycine soja]|nr:hypothetical protein JHK87_045617 [Glycine soja]
MTGTWRDTIAFDVNPDPPKPQDIPAVINHGIGAEVLDEMICGIHRFHELDAEKHLALILLTLEA